MLRSSFVAGLALSMLCGSGLSTARAEEKPSGKLRVYLGTYTGPKSKGIYVCELGLADGSLSEPRVAAEAKNPSFLALHPDGKHLYAVSEVEGTGAVLAFAIDGETGALKALNHQPSGGAGPCHVSVDKEGHTVAVANYSGGSVSSMPIVEHGKLGEPASVIQHKGSSVNKSRQSEPHAHSINFDAAGHFAFAADLGLDKVLVYRVGAHGKLEPNDPPSASVSPGSGPRHFAFHPSGKFAYVINEMGNTVTAFSYDAEKGKLSEIQTIATLPSDFTGNNTTAEVQVHPSGKFVYGSNRGHNSLAIFRVDPSTGKLTAAGHQSTGGKTPRNFGIDPTGHYILAANQDSDDVLVFRVNQETGGAMPTGASIKVGSPVCVKFQRL